MLGLLEAVQADSSRSQRHLASELGIAVGLVNAYLKRCINKGLVKVSQAPARRYAYYLTPDGFAEKSRLAFEYLSDSFEFFRHARSDCAAVLADAHGRGWSRVALLGASELSEIMALCALEHTIDVVAVVDPAMAGARKAGHPVVASLGALAGSVDGAIVTAFEDVAPKVAEARRALGAERVLVPAMLASRLQEDGSAS